MTVLHVVGALTVGGSERQMHTLIRELAAAGVRSQVAYLRPGTGELAVPLAALGATPRPVALGGSLARPRALVAIARLALRCRLGGVALVHAHDYAADLVGVAAARLARLPVIASRRDLGDWRSPHERLLLGLACRRADRVLVNAGALAAVVAGEGVPVERLRIVPNAIDLDAFDAAARRPPDPPLPPRAPGRPLVAVVGNMDRPHKGHADLLEAAARLGRPLTLLVLSDGPLRPALEARAAELGVDARFLGRRRDVPAILARADALVHPSWSEGFPNAVLEAMCAGLPVVATDVGGTAELVGDAGTLVPPRDPLALAAALARLCDGPAAARRLGARARARVAARFSTARLLADVLAVYAELTPAARAATARLELAPGPTYG